MCTKSYVNIKYFREDCCIPAILMLPIYLLAEIIGLSIFLFGSSYDNINSSNCSYLGISLSITLLTTSAIFGSFPSSICLNKTHVDKNKASISCWTFSLYILNMYFRFWVTVTFFLNYSYYVNNENVNKTDDCHIYLSGYHILSGLSIMTVLVIIYFLSNIVLILALTMITTGKSIISCRKKQIEERENRASHKLKKAEERVKDLENKLNETKTTVPTAVVVEQEKDESNA